MSKYFEQALPQMFEDAFRDFLLSIARRQDEITKVATNGLSNSRYPLHVQELCFEGVRAYSKQLITRLEKIAHEDRVVGTSDYDKAALSVREFAKKAEGVYEEIRRQGEPFGDKRPPLDTEKMRAVVDSAANEIAEYQAVLRGKRSFRKWLLADLRKVSIASALLAVLAGLAGAFLKEWLLPSP